MNRAPRHKRPVCKVSHTVVSRVHDARRVRSSVVLRLNLDDAVCLVYSQVDSLSRSLSITRYSSDWPAITCPVLGTQELVYYRGGVAPPHQDSQLTHETILV